MVHIKLMIAQAHDSDLSDQIGGCDAVATVIILDDVLLETTVQYRSPRMFRASNVRGKKMMFPV